MSAASKPVVCTFESRRADEMRMLIEKFGGTPVSAPSMKEIPLEHNAQAVDGIRAIVGGAADFLILLTGVGTEAMLRLAAAHNLEQPLLQRMQQIPLLVRGPKPAAVLKRLGLRYTVKAAEPNTSRELLDAIREADLSLRGKTVAIQEYGVSSDELNAELANQGAHVLPLPVYRWALPDDIKPLESSVQRTIAGEFDILLFTSAQQVRHVLTIADWSGIRNDWLHAVKAASVSSIGPTCSETLRACGMDVNFEASPPKMGPLVRGAIEHWKQSQQG